MAVTQSRTQVNDKASGAEPMPKMNPSAVVPGQSITDIGGPTNTDYRPEGDSAKISNQGTSQVHDQVNDKAGAASSDGGGTGGATLKGGQTTLPGGGSSASYNGTSDGRGKGNDPMPKLNKGAGYGTHAEADSKAGNTLDELADAGGASGDFKAKAKVIFESALNQKLQIEVARLEEEFSTRFEQEITDIAEKVEGFLNYTSQQWLEENKLVVENGIKNELSESFMSGLNHSLTTIMSPFQMRSMTSLNQWSLNLMTWKTSLTSKLKLTFLLTLRCLVIHVSPPFPTSPGISQKQVRRSWLNSQNPLSLKVKIRSATS